MKKDAIDSTFHAGDHGKGSFGGGTPNLTPPKGLPNQIEPPPPWPLTLSGPRLPRTTPPPPRRY